MLIFVVNIERIQFYFLFKDIYLFLFINIMSNLSFNLLIFLVSKGFEVYKVSETLTKFFVISNCLLVIDNIIFGDFNYHNIFIIHL